MGLFSSSGTNSINWETLSQLEQLDAFIERSKSTPVMIFKHSTRCGISRMAKNKLESEWEQVNEKIIPVYLDLLAYRSISNHIADQFGVVHESPQVIILKNGQSIYNASHSSISVDAIKDLL